MLAHVGFPHTRVTFFRQTVPPREHLGQLNMLAARDEAVLHDFDRSDWPRELDRSNKGGATLAPSDAAD
jgi:hypothetical protein